MTQFSVNVEEVTNFAQAQILSRYVSGCIQFSCSFLQELTFSQD